EFDGRMRATETRRTYVGEHFGRFEAVETVARPFAYLYPASLTAVTEALLRHGVEVDELREEIELDVEVYTVEEVQRTENRFRGHDQVTVDAAALRETRRYSPGDRVVRTAQPLGNLIVYLLEPGADDGLSSSGIFDKELAAGQEFPIARVPGPAALTTRALLPLAEDRPRDQEVTLDAVYGDQRPVSFSGPPIASPLWMADGVHLVQEKDERYYKVEAATGRAALLADEDAMTAAIAALDGFDETEAREIAERLEGTFDPAFSALLFERDDDLYFAALDGSRALRLTDSEA
ncbi:MAG: hypothetical protein R3344_13830, partial [Acidobacteriota bacterium]|nr:hypothetical protein [Acidobacteriota bacterium]